MQCKNILPVERLSDTKASKRELYIRQKSEHEFVSPHALLKVQAVFFKMGQPRPLFVYFRSFQTINRIFTTNQCEKCQCIQFRLQDSNPRPFEHESSPITTRPGLPPWCRPSCHRCPVSSCKTNIKKLRGVRHSSVDPSAPTILRPGFKSQAQHQHFSQFIFWIVMWIERK